MARKRHTPEQIIDKLRQAEVEITNSATIAQGCGSTTAPACACGQRIPATYGATTSCRIAPTTGARFGC